MPHIIVKLWPGRSEEQKKALAEKMVKTMAEVMIIEDKHISLAFEEFPKERWQAEVYQRDIVAKVSLLYKKPGY